MDQQQIDALLRTLDGSGSDREYEAVAQLRALPNLPELLLKRYKQSRKWAERASCVYHAIREAKNSEIAVQLGILALGDRSKVVRYRAAMLLAVSGNRAALGPLRQLAASGGESSADAAAAIAAIEEQNQNLFVDRDCSGMVSLNVH